MDTTTSPPGGNGLYVDRRTIDRRFTRLLMRWSARRMPVFVCDYDRDGRMVRYTRWSPS